jgi:NTP pyrophosphatase (non-canonical NTP hydrolase)
MNRPAWFPFADALHRAVVEHRDTIAAHNERTADDQQHLRGPAFPGCVPYGRHHTAYDDQDGVFLAMGLAGEAGEVANEFKKWMRGDYTREEFLAKLATELADVRCMLELVARYAELDLDVVTPAKLEDFERKLIARGVLKAPVATRPMEPGERIFVCPNGHETKIVSHPIDRMACQYKDSEIGATCGALSAAKRFP